MRVPDKPLPGDLVIRRRDDSTGIRRVDVWVITNWPDVDSTVAGPYQSYSYALQQAKRCLTARSEWIWWDHARPGEPEQLELVADTSLPVR